jgi:serine/threonine-protein phosphatase 2A regulatory subunit B
VFEYAEDPAETSFFSEIISSISDVQFTPSGDQILSRDYLSLKLWDIRKENKPIEIIPIHDYLRPKLCDLYESDCIFDKFECAASADGKYEYFSNLVFNSETLGAL